jgi:hypothetical protein
MMTDKEKELAIEIELLKQIEELLEDIDKAKIYRSKSIYKLYNLAYKKNEQTSTCISCLKNRANLLRKYFDEHKHLLSTIEETTDRPTEQPDNTEDDKVVSFIQQRAEEVDKVILTNSNWEGKIEQMVELRKSPEELLIVPTISDIEQNSRKPIPPIDQRRTKAYIQNGLKKR